MDPLTFEPEIIEFSLVEKELARRIAELHRKINKLETVFEHYKKLTDPNIASMARTINEIKNPDFNYKIVRR